MRYVTKPFSPRELLARIRAVLRRSQTEVAAPGRDERSIDVQILRLRRKIEVDPTQPKFIRTERGVGYYFKVTDCPARLARQERRMSRSSGPPPVRTARSEHPTVFSCSHIHM
jgi:DNA-binding response OmpR family regulator